MSNNISYKEKLKSPKWQKKRVDILQRDQWACIECGDSTKTLHVHHITYKNGNAPWEYDDTNFQTLCEDCHSAKHNLSVNDSVSISTSFLQDERLRTMSECSDLITDELRPQLENLMLKNNTVEELTNFVRQYSNERVNILLFEFFSLHELTYNGILTTARFIAQGKLKSRFGEQYYSHPEYVKYRNQYIDEYVAANPIEGHILKSVTPQFEVLVLNALKLIYNRNSDDLQYLEEGEMMKAMEYLLKLKQVQIQMDSEYQEKSKKRLQAAYP